MEEILKDKFVALDSNVFVYHFESHPDFGPLAKEIFFLLEKGKFKAATSVTSLIELLSRSQLTKGALDLLEEKFSTVPNLQVFNVDEGIALEAARVRREYRFRVPDAIQLATALEAKAKVFVTNDKSLKRFKEINVLLLNEVGLKR